MEADVTTPEQGKALALELFDTPVDERGRRHRRRLLAGARTPARRVRRATSRRPVRPVCSLPGALRREHLTARTGGDFANSAGASPAMAASPSRWPPTCASAPTSSPNAETSSSDRADRRRLQPTSTTIGSSEHGQVAGESSGHHRRHHGDWACCGLAKTVTGATAMMKS
jgi:hypothetical protein